MMTMALSFLEGRNRLIGAVFFQWMFAVLVCFRCDQEGTVSIKTETTYEGPVRKFSSIVYILLYTSHYVDAEMPQDDVHSI